MFKDEKNYGIEYIRQKMDNSFLTDEIERKSKEVIKLNKELFNLSSELKGIKPYYYAIDFKNIRNDKASSLLKFINLNPRQESFQIHLFAYILKNELTFSCFIIQDFKIQDPITCSFESLMDTQAKGIDELDDTDIKNYLEQSFLIYQDAPKFRMKTLTSTENISFNQFIKFCENVGPSNIKSNIENVLHQLFLQIKKNDLFMENEYFFSRNMMTEQIQYARNSGCTVNFIYTQSNVEIHSAKLSLNKVNALLTIILNDESKSNLTLLGIASTCFKQSIKQLEKSIQKYSQGEFLHLELYQQYTEQVEIFWRLPSTQRKLEKLSQEYKLKTNSELNKNYIKHFMVKARLSEEIKCNYVDMPEADKYFAIYRMPEEIKNQTKVLNNMHKNTSKLFGQEFQYSKENVEKIINLLSLIPANKVTDQDINKFRSNLYLMYSTAKQLINRIDKEQSQNYSTFSWISDRIGISIFGYHLPNSDAIQRKEIRDNLQIFKKMIYNKIDKLHFDVDKFEGQADLIYDAEHSFLYRLGL